MLPFVFNIRIPVPIEKLGVDFRFDRTFLDLLLAFLVESVALFEWFLGVFGIDRRYESDVLAFRRPDAVAGFGADVGQLPRFAAVQIDDPQLIVATAVGFEKDMLAVGTPARMAIFF